MERFFIFLFVILFSSPALALSNREVQNYTRALRHSSITQRKQVLKSLYSRLREIRIQSQWILPRDSKGAKKTLKSLRQNKGFFYSLSRCARFKDLRKITFRCLSQLGGDQAAKVIYQIEGQRGTKKALKSLLSLGVEAEYYLVKMIQTGAAADKDEKILKLIIRDPHPRALSPLIALLAQPRSKVSPSLLQKAILTYGQKAFSPLKELSQSQSRIASFKAFLLLGRLKNERAVQYLVQSYKKSQSEEEKRILLQALGESRLPQAEEFLLLQSRVEDKELTSSMAASLLYALGFGKSEKGEKFLLSVARQKHQWGENIKLRTFALQALGQRRSKKALPLFVKALKGKKQLVEKGLLGISRLEAKEAKKAVLEVYHQSKDTDLRQFALSTLKEIEGKEAIPFFIKSFHKEKEKELRIQALNLARSFRLPQVENFLKKVIEKEPSYLRRRALLTLKKSNLPLLRQALKHNLLSSPSKIALQGAETLREIGLGEITLKKKEKEKFARRLFRNPQNTDLIALAGEFSLTICQDHLSQIARDSSRSWKVRQEAINSVAKIGGKKGKSLLQLLEKASQMKVKFTAWVAWGWYPLQEWKKRAESLISSSSSQKRKAAISALAKRISLPRYRMLTKKILLNSSTSRREKITAAKILWQGDRLVKPLAYTLLKGDRVASFTAFRILVKWGNFLDLKRLRKHPQKEKKAISQIIKHLELFEKGRGYRKQSSGQKALSTLKDLKKKVKEGESFSLLDYFCGHYFSLRDRHYYPVNRQEVRPLIDFLVKKDLKEAYIVPFSLYSAHTDLFQRPLPSDLEKGDLVLFFRHQSKVFILEEGKGGRWKIWGGV